MKIHFPTKRKSRVLAAVLTLALSTGAIAFAATSQTPSSASGDQSKPKLTDVQRTAVQTAKSDSMKEALAKLVKDGTISQADADKLPAFDQKPNKPTECAIIDNLTDSQRQALDTAKETVQLNAIASLVKDGTLTQDQADKLSKKPTPPAIKSGDMPTQGAIKGDGMFGQGKKPGCDKPQKGNASGCAVLTDAQRTALDTAISAGMKTALSDLVAKGTITQAIADQMTKMVENKANRPEQPAKVLTDAQMTSLQDTSKAIFKEKLATLVSNGTITSEQSNLLANDNGPGFGGPGGPRDGRSGPCGPNGCGQGGAKPSDSSNSNSNTSNTSL